MPSCRHPLAGALLLAIVAPTSALAAAPDDAGVDGAQARLLTSVVATAAAKDPVFDVLTRDDVKNALAVEADRQMVGCSASSCLAELASAMGARVVVYGSVGRLGDQLLLTLNLFDSDNATSGGRRIAQAEDMNGLAKAVGPTTTELLHAFVQAHPVAQGQRIKLLVLDLTLETPNADVAAQAPPPATTSAGGPSPVVIAGAGIGVLGLAVAGVGGWFDFQSLSDAGIASSPSTPQQVAATHQKASDDAVTYALIGYGAGVALVAVGGAVAAVGLFLE